MRLWSLHPRYLDAVGLVALWREALLAKAVLRGRTRGYRHHPQLARFRAARDPVAAINAYLRAVHAEAGRRGYRFSARKLGGRVARARLPVNRAQVTHEWRHLLAKLARRSPAVHRALRGVVRPALHPLFLRRPGGIEPWERGRRAQVS